MATEFYKSIPEEIKGKLEEYVQLYSMRKDVPIDENDELRSLFNFLITPEGHEFWYNHHENNTFPQWSDELNRFIDPPQVNTITVNADEYQAMREAVIIYLRGLYTLTPHKDSIIAFGKKMGIDINEITN